MANQFERGTVVQGRTADSAQIDEGLRAHMLRVYNYMTTGLALTGIIAYLVAGTPALANAILGTPLFWVLIIAQLGVVFYLGARIHKMSFASAQTVFWLYAGLNGLTFAIYFQIYTGESIARVFFITAAMFAFMSLYGYTTKRDLTRLGSFLSMGVFGILIAMVVNIFLQSPMIYFAVSVIGVIVFTGLTAYDTQKIKNMYYEGDSSENAGKKAIMGALTLYLDFILLFVMLLRLMGNQR